MGKQVIVIESREDDLKWNQFASHVLEVTKTIIVRRLRKMIKRSSYHGLGSPEFSEASVGLVADKSTISFAVGANIDQRICERWKVSYSPDEDDCRIIENRGRIEKHRKTLKGDCYYATVDNRKGEYLELYINQIFDGEKYNTELTEDVIDELFWALRGHGYRIN